MLITTAAIIVAITPLTSGNEKSDDEKLEALCHSWDEWLLETHPQKALARGDYRYADRLEELGPRWMALRLANYKAFRVKLRSIDYVQLSDDGQLTHDLFLRMLNDLITEHEHSTYLYPVWQRGGPQQSIPQMAEFVRFERQEDYLNYLSRLEAIPRYLEDITNLLKRGVETGYTPPRVVMARILDQMTAVLNDGLDDLTKPFRNRPDCLAETEWDSVRQRFRETSMPAVRRALEAFAAYLKDEYVPACRNGIAATDLPRGKEFYADRLKMFTTTDLSAQQIHEIGLSEVARIRSEMLGVIRKTDFMRREESADAMSNDELFRAFIKDLRTNPRFYYSDAEEMLAAYRNLCKRIDAILPKFFEELPRLPYGVRAIPDYLAPGQTTAYYRAGDINNAEPGYFFVNTYKLDQRPKYEMVALALHEAVPGHHLQSALAQEMTAVPQFRRDLWFNAFGEGWALYAERLGIEMGLYKDPYDDFGRLLYEMWRACRLVVDPGMHALGWSREKARQYMMENTALSVLNVETEIDRYIAWPGQATAYKIGELKIRELRRLAEQRLGAQFDIRAFHATVLSSGSIPLDMLADRVESWIEEVATERDGT